MPRSLILETSQRLGTIALADGERILGRRSLDQARRHARDLAPFARALLDEAGWKAGDLEAVLVSRGPGSYTGLRVGIMSAKVLAYATGCALLGVDTFAALARQAPAEAELLDVLEDAQQGNIYVQRFRRLEGLWQPADELRIEPFAAWLERRAPDLWATGPGLAQHRDRLPPGLSLVPEADWVPRAESLLTVGLERWRRGERDDPFGLEPLYLRPSQAEQQWQALSPKR